MTRYERWTLWASALATGLTGIGFFWTKYLVEAPEPWAVVHHPLEPWLLKLHIVASPVFIFAVGMIATRHILVHLRSRVRRGRPSAAPRHSKLDKASSSASPMRARPNCWRRWR